jgi:hypothetical protein
LSMLSRSSSSRSRAKARSDRARPAMSRLATFVESRMELPPRPPLERRGRPGGAGPSTSRTSSSGPTALRTAPAAWRPRPRPSEDGRRATPGRLASPNLLALLVRVLLYSLFFAAA